MTISGENFQDDTRVFINREPCIILTRSAIELVVETPHTYKRDEEGGLAEATGDLYLRDSDYAIVTCPADINCSYQWSEAKTPEVTGYSLENGIFTCT